MTKVLQRDDAFHCRVPLDCTHEQHRRILGVFDDWQMYTDGITEAQNSEGEEFGDRRLSDLMIGLQGAGPGELVEQLVSRVSRFNEGNFKDDVTVLAVEVTGHSDNAACPSLR